MTLAEMKAYAATITKLGDYEHKTVFKKIFEEMAVHTRKRQPKEILLKRRPNEPDDVYQYRLDNYEPVTYGSMNKAFDNLYRILNGINSKLHITNDVILKYMETKKFKRNTFDMFFSKIYLKRMIEDPNGFLLWLPGNIKNDGEQIKPYPVLMFSFNIIDWGDDFIVFLSDEKSYITKDKNTVLKEGKIYYILTENEFYKYTELTGGKYELTLEYEHKLGEIPMIPLGGDFNADGHFESFFAPYVAFGNEAIRQFSDFQSLSVTAAHPIREVFMMQCEVNEVKGSKKKKGREGVGIEAAGIGQDDMRSYSRKIEVRPLGRGIHDEIQRPIPDESKEGWEAGLKAEIPSVRFINQDVTYVKNAKETTFELLEKAEDALHLNLGDVSLSGKAKEIDLLSHEDMLNKIANQLLDAKQTSARFVVAYMTTTTYENAMVKLTKPSSFRVKSEAELMNELSLLKTANAPSMLIAAVARQLAELRFSGDEVNRKIFLTVTTYDPLFMYSVAEKQSMVLSGTALKDLVITSNYFYSLLLKILDEKGEAVFVDSKPMDLFNLVTTEVKPFLVPAESIITDPNGNP